MANYDPAEYLRNRATYRARQQAYQQIPEVALRVTTRKWIRRIQQRRLRVGAEIVSLQEALDG